MTIPSCREGCGQLCYQTWQFLTSAMRCKGEGGIGPGLSSYVPIWKILRKEAIKPPTDPCLRVPYLHNVRTLKQMSVDSRQGGLADRALNSGCQLSGIRFRMEGRTPSTGRRFSLPSPWLLTEFGLLGHSSQSHGVSKKYSDCSMSICHVGQLSPTSPEPVGQSWGSGWLQNRGICKLGVEAAEGWEGEGLGRGMPGA